MGMGLTIEVELETHPFSKVCKIPDLKNMMPNFELIQAKHILSFPFSLPHIHPHPPHNYYTYPA